MMIYHERFKLRHVNNLLHDELHFLLRLLWDILGCSATSQFLTLFHWVVWILLVSVMQNPLWKRNKHTKKHSYTLADRILLRLHGANLNSPLSSPNHWKLITLAKQNVYSKAEKYPQTNLHTFAWIIGWENLLVAMIFKNLIFISLDYVPKFFGQNWCWTLLVLKG